MEHYISLLVSENFRFQAKIKAKFRVKRKSRILVLQNVRDLTFSLLWDYFRLFFCKCAYAVFASVFRGNTLYCTMYILIRNIACLPERLSAYLIIVGPVVVRGRVPVVALRQAVAVPRPTIIENGL